MSSASPGLAAPERHLADRRLCRAHRDQRDRPRCGRGGRASRRRGRALRGDIVVVACGAINSAALLLRSANWAHPDGLANGSGVVGRHHMCHNNSALIAISRTRTRPASRRRSGSTISISARRTARCPRPHPDARQDRRDDVPGRSALPAAGPAAGQAGETRARFLADQRRPAGSGQPACLSTGTAASGCMPAQRPGVGEAFRPTHRHDLERQTSPETGGGRPVEAVQPTQKPRRHALDRRVLRPRVDTAPHGESRLQQRPVRAAQNQSGGGARTLWWNRGRPAPTLPASGSHLDHRMRHERRPRCGQRSESRPGA